MLTRWNDFDRDFFSRGFAAFDELRRTMDAMNRELDRPSALLGRYVAADATWPRTNLYDTGSELVLYAAVPGLSAKDIQITASGDGVTITGERAAAAPAGYAAHRKERGAVKFSRSFSLPAKVDLEKATASVKDGMLELRIAKAPEAQPRRITVKAS